MGTPTPDGELTILQTVGATYPNLNVCVDNGSGTASPALTINSAISYANAQATLSASRSILDVGTFGDSAGIGHSAVFRGNVGTGTSTPSSKLNIAQTVNAASPDLDVRVDNGSGSTAPVLTVNAATSYANVQATLPSRSIPTVGTYGDGSGVGYSAIFHGNVGIGTASPAQALEVNGGIKVDALASATSTNLCINAGVLSSCSSSSRYKEDIRGANFGLDDVENLRPVLFKWKGRSEQDFGLIAEKVAKVNPLFVTYKGGKIEGVKYPQLTVVLIGAVKELQKENNQQAAELARLKSEEANAFRKLETELRELKEEHQQKLARN